MLGDVLLRDMALRQKHCRNARTAVLCRVDVKHAFRQVPVTLPARQPLGSWPAVTWLWICVCSSGGGTAPGIGGWKPLRSNIPTKGAAGVAHVEYAPPKEIAVVPLPRDFQPVPGVGGNTGSDFFLRYYVDDSIIVELQWWPDGRRCRRALQSLA